MNTEAMNNLMPQRIDGILSKALGNETLLYWANGKTIHVLNRTARMIWELCDGQHTVQEMEAAIRAEFQLSDPQIDIASDIHRSLQQFVAAGLLEPASGQRAPTLSPKP